MTSNRVDADVALEVICHEGLVRQTYRDSVGKLTWCVGMTNATGHHVERYIDNPASLQRCMDIFAWALANYADGVRAAFQGHTLTKAQFAAALSFHWNTGAIGEASWVRHWRAGDVTKARKAFMNWRRPPEIIERRSQERDLFFDGIWSNDGTTTEYTRVTSSMTPDWSSARRVDVEDELHAAFAKMRKPRLDAAPQPDAKVDVPTLSPSQPSQDAPKPGGARKGIAALIALVGGLAASAYAYLKSEGILP